MFTQICTTYIPASRFDLVIAKSIKKSLLEDHVGGPCCLQVNTENPVRKRISKTTRGESSGNISDFMLDGNIQGFYFITVSVGMGRT